MPILSLGNEVSFELLDGDVVELPKNYWITVDKTGELWRRCDVAILPAFSAAEAKRQPAGSTRPFDGHLAGKGPGAFALPRGQRRRVGRVAQILYTRPDQGGKYHPFNEGAPVILYALSSRRGWIVELPDGCKVNALGFVWP